jgi:hypothetical protein
LPHSSALSSVSPSGVVPGLSNVLPTLKKRRKRTNLDNHQKDKLEAYFIVNPRPDHQEMNRVANELDLDPDVSNFFNLFILILLSGRPCLVLQQKTKAT